MERCPGELTEAAPVGDRLSGPGELVEEEVFGGPMSAIHEINRKLE